MTNNDGGPAFPGYASDTGMSLRDYFAAHALIGMLALNAGHPESGEALQIVDAA